MKVLEAVISVAILVILMVLAAMIGFWVLAECGLAIPQKVERLIYIAIALVGLLYLVRALLGNWDPPWRGKK